jgi:hypothetical protein
MAFLLLFFFTPGSVRAGSRGRPSSVFDVDGFLIPVGRHVLGLFSICDVPWLCCGLQSS